jgi:hypothetical protein
MEATSMIDVTAAVAAPLDGTTGAADSGEVPGLDAIDEQLIAQLADRARAGGLQLGGEGGLLQALTKRLMESRARGYSGTGVRSPRAARSGSRLALPPLRAGQQYR